MGLIDLRKRHPLGGQVHAKAWRDRTQRQILARMRHDGGGGIAGRAELSCSQFHGLPEGSGLVDPSLRGMVAGVEKRFEAVEDLIRQVESKAADEPDTLALMVALIKLVIRSEVDPYLLSGVLIEGIANTLARRIPEDRKREVAAQAIRLLHERLQASGAI